MADGMLQDNGIGLQAEGSVIVPIGVGRWMPLPAEPRVNGQTRVDAVVVLDVSVELLQAGPPEGCVLTLAVGAGCAEEEIGVSVTRVGLGAVVGSRSRIVNRG